ncbi:MAG: NMP kinase [Dehalococcoidia bacterium]|nr:NMP kinase [Dehalococcoidia bacterium]|tara:strand:- start:668 stop:1177 length:510 start_codon:yes stop_codon:yes gene_type:complete
MDRIAITGVPGTGKTTVSALLNKNVMNLSDLYEKSADGREEDGTWIIDTEKMATIVANESEDNDMIEGHLSHLLGISKTAIVLRCHPTELKKRLKKRKYNDEKIQENLEAECLGIITNECLEEEIETWEVDTTDTTPEKTAKEIEEIIQGSKIYTIPNIDYSNCIMDLY